jgi:isochorismate pyruvate lyase
VRPFAPAARIKQDRHAVRDEARKADVIAKVSRAAGQAGIPADVVRAMWELLVEGSIGYELERFEALRPELSAR